MVPNDSWHQFVPSDLSGVMVSRYDPGSLVEITPPLHLCMEYHPAERKGPCLDGKPYNHEDNVC